MRAYTPRTRKICTLEDPLAGAVRVVCIAARLVVFRVPPQGRRSQESWAAFGERWAVHYDAGYSGVILW